MNLIILFKKTVKFSTSVKEYSIKGNLFILFRVRINFIYMINANKHYKKFNLSIFFIGEVFLINKYCISNKNHIIISYNDICILN